MIMMMMMNEKFCSPSGLTAYLLTKRLKIITNVSWKFPGYLKKKKTVCYCFLQLQILIFKMTCFLEWCLSATKFSSSFKRFVHLFQMETFGELFTKFNKVSFKTRMCSAHFLLQVRSGQ